jgi:hypothetical protein
MLIMTLNTHGLLDISHLVYWSNTERQYYNHRVFSPGGSYGPGWVGPEYEIEGPIFLGPTRRRIYICSGKCATRKEAEEKTQTQLDAVVA